MTVDCRSVAAPVSFKGRPAGVCADASAIVRRSFGPLPAAGAGPARVTGGLPLSGPDRAWVPG